MFTSVSKRNHKKFSLVFTLAGGMWFAVFSIFACVWLANSSSQKHSPGGDPHGVSLCLSREHSTGFYKPGFFPPSSQPPASLKIIYNWLTFQMLFLFLESTFPGLIWFPAGFCCRHMQIRLSSSTSCSWASLGRASRNPVLTHPTRHDGPSFIDSLLLFTFVVNGASPPGFYKTHCWNN